MLRTLCQDTNAIVVVMRNLSIIQCAFHTHAASIVIRKSMRIVLMIDVIFCAILEVAHHVTLKSQYHAFVEKNHRESHARFLKEPSSPARTNVVNS